MADDVLTKLREAITRYEDQADYGQRTSAADDMAEAIKAYLAIPSEPDVSPWCYDMEAPPHDDQLEVAWVSNDGQDRFVSHDFADQFEERAGYRAYAWRLVKMPALSPAAAPLKEGVQ